jgi:hypothetical protein
MREIIGTEIVSEGSPVERDDMFTWTAAASES